jgi:hypothetical protein
VNQTVTTLLRAAASTLQTDSFEPSDSQSGVTTASSILAGDFDENGRADVVDANALTSSSLAVMLGPCPATALATYSAVVPGGGQVWLTGTNQTISWSGSTTSGPVTIEVSRDSGTHWETIATNVLGPPFVWTVTPQVTHHARIRVRNMVLASNPGASTSDFLIVSSLVGAGPERMPSNLALSPPSPNPSAGLVNFELALPYSASVEAGVYDVSGRRIRALLHGTLSAGRHEIAWDGRDESGEAAAAGLYFVKATGPGWSETRRVMRLR